MRRAFSLIELLVVVAIIVVLAAILFPVFARAKSAAKKTVGLSNTRQLALAVMLYLPDYDDRYPVGISKGEWIEELQRYRYHTPWFVRVWPYMKNREVREDPSHPRRLPRNSREVITWGTHYGMNISLGWIDGGLPGSALQYPAGLVGVSLAGTYSSTIRTDAEKLDPDTWPRHLRSWIGWGVYGPTYFRGNAVRHPYSPAPQGWEALVRVAGVHSGAVTVAFADGHAKPMPIKRLVGPMPLGFPLGDPQNVWDNQ